MSPDASKRTRFLGWAALLVVACSGSPPRPPQGLIPIGGQCVADSDCTSTACITTYPGGYCSAQCEMNADCPSNSACIQTSQGVLACHSKCSTSADCRSGYSCQGTPGVCLPGSSGSDAGTSTLDAGTGGNGTFCQSCQQSSDCGNSGNFCLQDPSGNGFCGTACTSDTDCPSGAQCFQITDQSGNVVGSNCAPMSGSCSG